MNLYRLSVLLLLCSSMHAMHKQVIPVSSSSDQSQGLHGIVPVENSTPINMDAIDPLTRITHAEQAKKAHQQNLYYVVAQVATLNPRSILSRAAACIGKNQSATSVYYCDAFRLLNAYGKTAETASSTDPVKHRKVEGLGFYTVAPKENKFLYFCSGEDMLRSQDKNKFLTCFFGANQGGDGQEKALQELGSLYVSGQNDIKTLMPCIKLLALQNYNPKVAALAQYDLAMNYADGRGVPQDIEKATRLLDQVANQQDDRSTAAAATFMLCMMCLRGEIGGAQEQERAFTILGLLQFQDDNREIAQKASGVLFSLILSSADLND